MVSIMAEPFQEFTRFI